jgi:hypothetical protein
MFTRTYSIMEPRMSFTSKRREGFALAVAMVAIVVIGALIAGAFFTSTQEYRIGRNSLMDQRAFAAAEAGVTQPIQGWIKQLNLSMGNGATANPDTLKITGGSYAVRRITRLDDYTFWVSSDGYAGPAGTLASHHKVNAVYRLAYPKFNILGALTVRGQVQVQGSSRVDGRDEIPAGWVTSGICPAASGGVAGVAAPDTTIVCSGTCPEGKNPGNRIDGIPAPKSQNPVAGDPNTYLKFGDQSWDMLTANADIKLPGGNYSIAPTVTGTNCQYSNTSNWGDPLRTTACADYFPIIYVNGDLKIQANSIAQGVLLVNGSVEMAGNFTFNGIMVVKNDIKSTGNGNKITGSAFAGNTYTADNTSINGNSEIQYSSCAVERAGKASALVVRAKERGFAEIIQ